MIVNAVVQAQTDGTWLARIDRPHRVFGIDNTADLAAHAAGALLRWTCHPEPIEVRWHEVPATSSVAEPVRHPSQRPGEYEFPYWWIVIPLTVRRHGKWDYRGSYEGFCSISANGGSVPDVLEAASRIVERLWKTCWKNGPALADFVVEPILVPDDRDFENDDGPLPLNETTMRLLDSGTRITSISVPGPDHNEYDRGGKQSKYVSLKDRETAATDGAGDKDPDSM